MRGHTPHKALNVCIKCGGVFKRGRGLLSHLELATESCEKSIGAWGAKGGGERQGTLTVLFSIGSSSLPKTQQITSDKAGDGW